MSKASKFITVEEAVARIPDGAQLAVSGNMEMSPMALIRALVRAKKRGLRLVCAGAAAINADLLIGAGVAVEVEFSQISMGEYGFAPNFRRAFEQGAVVGLEHACPTLTAALGAGAAGIPFVPVRGLIGTDYMRIRPDFQIIPNPYDPAEKVAVVPAIRPDVAIFHGFLADTDGYVLAHPAQNNRLLAQASRQTFVTVEGIVTPEALRREAGRGRAPLIPPLFITGIAHAPGGALPTSCPDYYEIDDEAVQAYMQVAASEETFAAYAQQLLAGEHKGVVV